MSILGVARAAITAIAPESRVCEKDNDCVIIHTACSCLCGGEGHEAAVNQKFVSEFKDLENCSSAELKTCSEAGACAQITIYSAICMHQQCEVLKTPARHE